ncbi:GNAT family N-acetyltransferase [uncultured Shewanella sp.]|uniref:GNAT family N-acetyltransferase n=1 Tax=uncultured Shewanella sp. TaxID=173975 RepID=UPI00262596FA|nr:GNAT family N-acetyltransferase [uncultured Shewanella sp.]
MALLFTTSRLDVSEIFTETAQCERFELLRRIPELLTAQVVESLPTYFHDIDSQVDAARWLERMMSESHLFAVKLHHTDFIIGFVFVYIENEGDAHIGYLLGENYWGQGLASELLSGFIKQVIQTQSWTKLIAGVAPNNQASCRLLVKLGFAPSAAEGPVTFYEYQLS